MKGGTTAAACPACDGVAASAIRHWLRRCPDCGLWASALAGERVDRAPRVEEAQRELGLRALRRENFERILDALSRHGRLEGARLLEVGCAYGWFLEAAARRGVAAVGLEPDADVAAKALAAGLEVRQGYFPGAVGEGETFDVVVFNDVFEHLEDPPRVLQACARILRPGGRLVLNLPDSDGLLFRTACRLACLGVGAPLERLWQARFRFPHLWYFNAENLGRLVERRGFRLLHGEGLPALRREGLWARLRMDRTAGWLSSAVAFVALQALAPLLARASPDILLQIYERAGADPPLLNC
jgi:2-polyprenyl-3-methyl-5-hydroxy-6-metoxy-1,4-benzoquinol methylase